MAIKAPKILSMKQIGGREVLRDSLQSMLEDVEIKLRESEIDTETGKLKEYKVKGLDCVGVVMQAMAGEVPLFSKILDLESYVSSPMNQHLYPQFFDENERWVGPNLDELCNALNIRSGQFIGTFLDAVRDYGRIRAKVKIDLSIHEVVGAARKNALGDTATSQKDRELIFKAAKLIEGGGVNVNVNQSNTTNNNSVAVFPGANEGLPKWQDAKELAMQNATKEIKQLSPVSLDFVDGEVEEQEEEKIYVSSRSN